VNIDINQKVKTPCIGVCSTGIGDSVCRGCKRFAHEVIHWNGYTDDQKLIIDRRLASFLSQIVATKLIVVDQNLLVWQLDAQQISYQSYKSPYIWAYELLRAGASQIDDLSHFGLRLQEAFNGYPLRELRLLIDEEFYLLSRAHYQRYFELDRDSVTDILEQL
jgi:predicted Fe-S protein YdhL (DUF1289 family)